MKYIKNIILIILLMAANFAFAVTITPIQLKPSFFEKVSAKIMNCNWHISCYFQKNYGATLVTITGADTVQNALKVITNANFTALNTGKFELSDWYATTTAPQLTNVSNVSALGTITSGTWNASTLTVAYGGTGSTTLSAYHVLLGNGTGNIGVVSGLGTSGQFLTSGGAGTAPTWTTSSINEAGNYAWTGQHSFANTGQMSIAASTTFSAATTTTTNLMAQNQIQTGKLIATSTTASQISYASSTAITISGTASTTNLIISGTCTGCVPMYAGSDSTPSDTTDDTNVITVGFKPRMIIFEIDAVDTDEVSWAWGNWTDPDGDGTGSYSVIQSENSFGAAQRQTSAAHANSFTGGRMIITFINFTDTGFSILYDKNNVTDVSSASISFTALK